MILFVAVNLKRLSVLGRKYRWRRPALCPGRPKGYFTRFQSAIGTIRAALGQRLGTGRWPAGGAARGRHWLSALKRQVLVHLGMAWLQRLAAAFDRLRRMGLVPVSRSFLRGGQVGRP
jgi:hypothetical protein